MMKRFLLAAALCFVSTSTWAGPAPAVSPDANGRVPLSKGYTDDTKMHAICQSVGLGLFAGITSVATQYAETTRMLCTTEGPISQVRLYLSSKIAITGQESSNTNTVFHRATLEYPLGGNVTQFALNGQSLMAVDPLSSGALTDKLGVIVPAQTTFAIRYATYVAWPPATPAVAASTGGSLTASTTYFYKETCVKGGSESGPTAEVSAATTTSNLTEKVTWAATVNPLGCDSVNVYRSTATGTEAYLATVLSPGLSYVDTGAYTTTAQTPPTQPKWVYGGNLLSTMNTTASTCSGNQSDTTAATGAFGTSGPSSCYVSLPAAIVADDVNSVSVCGLGTSIETGTGIVNASANVASNAPQQANWFAAGLPQGTFNSLNLSVSGSQSSTFLATNNYGVSQRLQELDFCSAVVSDLATNDIYGQYAATWQQAAGYQIAIAQANFQRGRKWFITTAIPRVTSTDNLLTVSAQTLGTTTQETARENYNLWVRGGLQVSGTTPVLSGGTKTPYIAGFFDLANAIGEVNASGTPTANGGYWPVYPTAIATGTFTGTPTTTAFPVGAASYVQNGIVGQVMKITSGAANGQTCAVYTNSATQINCVGVSNLVTTAPAAGDTFSLFYNASYEGTHPSLHEDQAALTAAFNAWATANLTGF